MIEHKFNKELNILEVNYFDDVSLEELLENLKYMEDNSSFYPQKLLVLTDTRQRRLSIAIEDLPKVAQAISDASKNYKLIINAYIIDSPNAAVLSTLFRELSLNVPNFLFYIYSTKEAALNYLLNHK